MRPDVGTIAEELFAGRRPVVSDDQDEARGWATLLFLGAVGSMVQPIDDLVRDTPDGPGWSALLNATRALPEGLPWLAMVRGARLPVGATEEIQRELIRDVPGRSRGRPSAIVAAAKATLTGTRTVILRERDGSPYRFTVLTFADETPDLPTTRAAIADPDTGQKPGGLVLNYAVVDGMTWTQLEVERATWNAVAAAYPTWNDIVED